jgi:ABC-type bacteriocin/lantibiotic exporter with double-glycine peptidase domain
MKLIQEPQSEHDGRRESIWTRSYVRNLSIPVIRFRDVHFLLPFNLISCFNGLDSRSDMARLYLCGRSGCGKSSSSADQILLSLLKGIVYNGVDMKEISIKWLQGSQIGLVNKNQCY